MLDDWTLMEGEKILVGISRWANHSCQPNCDYYKVGRFKGRECVRLCALREIDIGEEMVTYYSEIFFGEGSENCLCGHSEKHVVETFSSNHQSGSMPPFKRRQKSKTAIKMCYSDHRADQLADMIRFYDALENDDSSSITQGSDARDNELSAFELKATSDVEIEAEDGSETALKYMQDPDSICEIQNDFDFETNSTTSESSDGGISSSLALGGHTKLHEVGEVTPVSLAASLVAIVSKHNGSDAP